MVIFHSYVKSPEGIKGSIHQWFSHLNHMVSQYPSISCIAGLQIPQLGYRSNVLHISKYTVHFLFMYSSHSSYTARCCVQFQPLVCSLLGLPVYRSSYLVRCVVLLELKFGQHKSFHIYKSIFMLLRPYVLDGQDGLIQSLLYKHMELI